MSREWWKADTEVVINQAMQQGVGPNVSVSHTINGHPDGFKLNVENGKTYMLRIINAALNDDLFFKIAGNKITVVEVDAIYTKPFNTGTLLIAPGQTTNVLSLLIELLAATFSQFLPSWMPPCKLTTKQALLPCIMLTLSPSPSVGRSLNSEEYPANVPQTVDHSLLFTVGVRVNPCAKCINATSKVGWNNQQCDVHFAIHTNSTSPLL
ncbi:hypothetical protein C2845_PM18G13040 [Panicum miliaceum]|uniref:laccase n=1 Tax=Panicum miliaceum TaxID=4540 RepID=A0A3L6PK10_PANMI|nr:hypothetical protein C2845_PM18G13040 [Panicum miliaceum]